MSQDNDDDRTMIVRPVTTGATPAKAPPPAPPAQANDADDGHDKTVFMKPSQRSREAAAALSAQRKREQAGTPVVDESASIDFDVTRDTLIPQRRQGNGWLTGFLVGLVLVLGVLLALLLL